MLAAGWVMPSVWGVKNQASVSANDQIRVGLIGCRSMGWADLTDIMRQPEVRCVALCDIDQKILADRTAELTKQTGKKPDGYDDYRKMLERKDMDAVIIGTPDHWHCLQLVDACAAGKDVYVEKPIANSIAECDLMVAVARRYNRVVQVGQQQRSGAHWHDMKRYLESGQLGKIAKVEVWANFNYAAILDRVPDGPVPEGGDFERWLGPAPSRSFNEKRFHGLWRMFWDYGGGLLTDWGVHLLDMALWGMNVTGMPRRVVGVGGNYAYPQNYAETFDTLTVLYEFDDFILQWSNVAGTETGPYGRCYGVAFKGTNGTLVINRESWEVYPEKDRMEGFKKDPDTADHQKHTANFVTALKQRDTQLACPIDNGALCAKYAHLGNISARVGSALTFDDRLKTFHNPEADKLIQPTYRAPWTFPKL